MKTELTMKEVAAELGVNRQRANQLCLDPCPLCLFGCKTCRYTRKRLPSIMRGRQRMVKAEDLILVMDRATGRPKKEKA